MKTKCILTAALAAVMAFAPALRAEEGDAPKFKFTPSGRILLDGALFAPTRHGMFADGVAVPDVRIGGKAEYGNWMAKIDIGYAFGKVGMKDVYLQYSFNPDNLIRGGYFVNQFGLQSATSSSFKETFEAPITDTYMNCTGRNLGFMFLHYKDEFLASASLIFGTKITDHANANGRVSVGGISRLLWRPLRDNGTVAQVGVSGWYQSANHTQIEKPDGSKGVSAGYFDYSASYPTRVDDVTLLKTNISDARSVFKLSPEFLLAKGRFSLGGQYYYMNVNRRHGNHAFISNGAYGVLRGLICGDSEYAYSSIDGGLATPSLKHSNVC